MEIKKINLNGNNQASAPSTSSQPSEGTTPSAPKSKFTNPLLFILIIGLGIASGAVLKGFIGSPGSSSSRSGVESPEEGQAVQPGEVFGAKDASDFADEATGILEAGGINGEGTHKLIRSGGVSQIAYLTSSVLDLDEFEGFKITVWGETFTAQKAGWLMDVGRVKVEELNPTPLEE
jgi:hypothetical protein